MGYTTSTVHGIEVPDSAEANNVPEDIGKVVTALEGGSIVKRLTGAQISALTSPQKPAGLVVYNTTVGAAQISDGTNFKSIPAGTPAYAIGNRPVGTTQSLARYATDTLTYSSEDDPSSLLSSGVFTAPAAGLYQVSAWYGFVTANNVAGRGSLVHNSTDVAQADVSKYGGTTVASLAALVYMAASDTMKLTVWDIGSDDTTVGIYGRLGVFRIGA
jgi:hypothetical protein